MDTSLQTQPEEVGLCSRQLRRVTEWSQRWVDSGRLPGVTTLVMRRGRVAHFHSCGLANVETGAPMRHDTIVRIYSMTKPLTSLAVMMLYEAGHFQLDDPVARYLPFFASMQVSDGAGGTVPAARPISIRDLLTHTAGLSYGFIQNGPVEAAYREAGIDFQTAECSLGELVERAAALPLLAQPGTRWNYSIATDVLGYLVEVISGEPFEAWLQREVLHQLGMSDTGFHVPAHKHERFAANYGRSAEGGLTLIDDPATSRFLAPRSIASGGGGLVSTAGDYMRFCRFMLSGGELDGVRLIGRKTVELMTANHVGGDLASMGMPRFSESSYEGIGFGLGFSVMLDPARAQVLGTPGEFAWGGMASTAFWVDPAEDMAVVLLTQLTPSSTYPIRRELRVLTYAAVID